jgi:hypothetical protein
LYEKKRSPERELKIPDSLYQYVIMNRNDYMTRGAIDFYKAYIKDRRNGVFVGSQIRQIIREKTKEVYEENRRLANENYALKKVKEWLENNGINYNNPSDAINDIINRQAANPEIRNLIEKLAEKVGLI